MNRQGRSASSTCTANSLAAAATHAAARHLKTRTPTILRAELPRCECGGGIRPHICWFGEVPFDLDRIFRALDSCTTFTAVGTSGVVEQAASFVARAGRRARTIYVGAEEPANVSAFTECHIGKAGDVLPNLLGKTHPA
jgi:NAD-dependent SIR2 family protein deacetylase